MRDFTNSGLSVTFLLDGFLVDSAAAPRPRAGTLPATMTTASAPVNRHAPPGVRRRLGRDALGQGALWTAKLDEASDLAAPARCTNCQWWAWIRRARAIGHAGQRFSTCHRRRASPNFSLPR